MLSTSKLPCTVLETGIHLVLFVSTSSLGRDEKGCKMDVDSIDQVEKGSGRHRPVRKVQSGWHQPAGKVQSGRCSPRKVQLSMALFMTKSQRLTSTSRKVQWLTLTIRKEQCGRCRLRKELSGRRSMLMAAFFSVDSRQPLSLRLVLELIA